MTALALAGGQTPEPLFETLSKSNIDWEKVTVIPTDERIVSKQTNRSNTQLIRKLLLKNCAGEAKMLKLNDNSDKLRTKLKNLSHEIKIILPIDVCVLGMGNDMHTASIFPDSDQIDSVLNISTNEVLMRITSPSVPEARLTLTSKVLKAAKQNHLLFTGTNKLTAFQNALKAPNEHVAPVRLALFGYNTTHVHYAP